METHHTPGDARAVSEHLQVAGNCQNINHRLDSHLLSDSLCSEQKKLRHVLDWARRFLSGGSEVYHELCRADSLILAFEKDREKMGPEKTSPGCQHPSEAKRHHPVSMTACADEILEGGSAGRVWEPIPINYKNMKDNLNITLVTLERDGLTCPENRETGNMTKSWEPQRITNKQSQHQDNCTTSGLYIHHRRQKTNMSDSSTNQTLAPTTCLIKESCWSGVVDNRRAVFGAVAPLRCGSPDMMNKTAGAQSSGAISENQQRNEAEGVMDDEKEEVNTRLKDNLEEKLKEQESSSASTALCTNDTMRQENNLEEMAKYCHMAIPSNVSDVISKNQDGTTYIRYLEALVEHGDNLNLKESRALCQKNCVHGDYTETNAEAKNAKDKVVNTQVKHMSAAPNDVPKYRHVGVKGQKKTKGTHSAQSEKSRMALFSLSNGKMLTSRPQSAGANKYTKRLDAQMHTKRSTLEDRAKTPASPDRDTHTCLQPSDRHTLHHNDVGPASSASRTTVKFIVNKTDSPAGVPVCDRWLRLPDEVWLSILSLLSHTDLCRVAQVCSRLHTLSTDHTLWKRLRVENSTLTEQWLFVWGQRRPRSLCLYSCTGLSVTSRAVETFLTLCRNDLQEVKVTSCTGPGLHGDKILPLIGQLCDHVTSVDVSWSGATDAGVNALSDGRAAFRLKSAVLSGCLFTDDPLKKLVTRHKESLVRLEVFGCQYLSPSCLQAIYEMCPGLTHLNIGQVPKVNAHSLTVMAAQLRCLISINLTGLQAVADSNVATLLQNCTELQSLSLCCCPGVTDLTLHNVSKYTPCIRSLDVSGCGAVTDAGVRSLTLGCSRLQQLDLSSTSTGNRGVTLLANYCNGHLHTVKLSFCHITSENILKLLRRCKRLKVLHLYGCAHVPSEREIRGVNTRVKVYPPP